MLRRCNYMRLLLAALMLIYAGSGIAAAQPAIPDFTFAHTSDDHAEPQAGVTIAEFVNPQPILLEPYKVTALPVSFVITTGDVTEFGGHAAWMTYEGFYSGVKIPHYVAVGNHDGTWRSLTYEVRQLYGSPYYSFDKSGCHFVILDSAGFQHPVPSFGPEQLMWLKKDLEKAGKDVPVFIALHHPLNALKEFASPYDVDRLLDVIRPYNIAVVMYGHGHNASHGKYENFDVVQGGTTGGPAACPVGYQVYSIIGGILRIAYKDQGKPVAVKAMLEKPLAPPAKRYPAIKIDSPREGSTYRARMPVKAWIGLGKGEVKSAFAQIDGAGKTDLALVSGGSFECAVALDTLSPGAHSLKLTFTGLDNAAYYRSTFFYVDSTRPKVRWRVLMDTASKTTPTISDSMVYIGGYDGTVRAYDSRSGKLRWRVQTGGAVAGQILLMGDKVYVGSEDKTLYCLTAAKGRVVWQFEAEEPIYSSPVSDGKSIYFGCGTGAFYSVDVATGGQNWKNSNATYNIEIKPFLSNGKVYYGAWDSYVYCLNTADGKLVWKCKGKGSSEGGGSNYYSPADAGPIVCNGNVFVPDRKYRCGIIDDASGKMVTFIDSTSSAGLSADGASVYLRKTDRKIQKVDSTGKVLWSADVPTDDAPTVPQEVGGVVYVCGKRGTVSAVSASEGKVLWQYDSTPSEYVLAGVNAAGSTAYVVGTDGSLTALGE